MEQVFKHTMYGKEREFCIGQKVKCIYYHEYDPSYEPEIKKRSLLSRLIDNRFEPVKFGVIVGSAGVHPYWLGMNKKEEYLWVNFKEYKLPKAIPISCCYDAIKAAKDDEKFLKDNEHMIGERGYDLESFIGLSNTLEENKKFISNQ